MARRGKAMELTVLIEKDEAGYYVGRVPALKGCHTQAKTLPKLRERIREAIALCMEEEKPDLLKFVAVEQMEIPA